MHFSRFQRKRQDKTLFVWDGTNDHNAQLAEHAAKTDTEIVAVHAMPHESIYSYGSILNEENEPAYAERVLHRKFATAMNQVAGFKNVKLKLLFGDRISEIVRFANANKVSLILIPSFCQSSFSRWIHGDLNERFVAKAKCPVVFLESKRYRSIVRLSNRKRSLDR